MIGIITAWEDFKTSKIRNKWILTGLAGGLLLHALFIISSMLILKDTTIHFGYVLNVFINAALSFIFAIILWRFGVWSAGDSKLFFVLSFLLPLKYYEFSFVKFFPSFNLAINIFAMSLAAILIKVIYGATAPAPRNPTAAPPVTAFLQPRSSLSAVIDGVKKNWITFFMIFVFFNCVFTVARGLITGRNNSETASILRIALIFLMYPLGGFLREKIQTYFDKHPERKPAGLTIAIVIFLALALNPYTGKRIEEIVKITLVFMLTVGLIRNLLDKRMMLMDSYRITVADLRPGMLLSYETQNELTKLLSLDVLFGDGLTEEQVELIVKSQPNDKELLITKTMPFAPIALAGLVLTLFIHQSLLHLVLKMMGR